MGCLNAFDDIDTLDGSGYAKTSSVPFPTPTANSSLVPAWPELMGE